MALPAQCAPLDCQRLCLSEDGPNGRPQREPAAFGFFLAPFLAQRTLTGPQRVWASQSRRSGCQGSAFARQQPGTVHSRRPGAALQRRTWEGPLQAAPMQKRVLPDALARTAACTSQGLDLLGRYHNLFICASNSTASTCRMGLRSMPATPSECRPVVLRPPASGPGIKRRAPATHRPGLCSPCPPAPSPFPSHPPGTLPSTSIPSPRSPATPLA